MWQALQLNYTEKKDPFVSVPHNILLQKLATKLPDLIDYLGQFPDFFITFIGHDLRLLRFVCK